jgi:hypothetical protein
VADELDHAISLFEDGQLEGAARALARTRGAAVTRNHLERLTEIDHVVSQIQTYLTGADRAAFDEGFSGARTHSRTTSARTYRTNRRKQRHI